MKFEIQAFGDVSLSGLHTDPQYYNGLAESLRKLEYEIGKPHLRMLNWEAPITTQYTYHDTKKLILAATESSANNFLNNFKIDVACLANNHIYDCKIDGVKSSLKTLQRYDVSTSGIGIGSDGPTLSIKMIGKIKIGIASFMGDETNPYRPENIDANHTVLNLENIERLIPQYAEEVDFLILNFHWGIEYTQYPKLEQKQLAKKAVDLGARVIVGHHSHCLQGAEHYNNGFIMYSLGNFVFSGLKGKESFGWPPFCNRGGMYRLFIDEELNITEAFVPFFVSNTGLTAGNSDKSIKRQKTISKRLKFQGRMYRFYYWSNSIYNYFFRLPLFLMKTKGGIFKGFMTYLKPKYFMLIFGYFFKKKNV